MNDARTMLRNLEETCSRLLHESFQEVSLRSGCSDIIGLIRGALFGLPRFFYGVPENLEIKRGVTFHHFPRHLEKRFARVFAWGCAGRLGCIEEIASEIRHAIHAGESFSIIFIL